MKISLTFSLLLGSVALVTLAGCSASTASGSGGANSGGDGNGSGGTGGGGSGGTDAGSGGGSGGSLTAAFSCPSGYEGMAPTLSGTPAVVATATGDQRFLEGPVWANGALYVSQLRTWGDPAPGNVLKLTGSSLVEFLPDASAGTNGLALRGDGKIVAASQRTHGLFSFDPKDAAAAAETLASSYEDKGFNSPNDLTIRTDGNIYFTDPDWNCGSDCPQGKGNNYVYRVNGSTVDRIDPPHSKPNGIALSPDESILYVGGDDAAIQAYPVASDGSIGSPTQFAAQTGVDGLAVDCAGNIYAAINGEGKLKVYSPSGAPLGEFSGLTGVTNAAFGGAENKTLYITHQLSVSSIELDIPGYPY